MSLKQYEFLSGVKAELPILIGVIPFGMIYGVLALDAGIPPSLAQAMSAIVFAGSAQIISTQLVSNNVPGIIFVLTISIVNLRHLLYSASIAPYLNGLNSRWKFLLAYLLTDEAYVVSIVHYDQDQSLNLPNQAYTVEEKQTNQTPNNKHWFFLGAGVALWVTWQLSTATGVFLGAVVPASWSLDFAVALTFIALVIPTLKDRPSYAAAISAGLVAIAAFFIPYKLGIITATMVGVIIGLLYEVKK